MIIPDLKYWKNVLQVITELHFPATEETISFRTPSFKVKNKFLPRLKEDGETLVIRCNDRDVWLDDDPEIFFFTDHYTDYPAVLVHLKKIGKKKLRELLIQCWKDVAPPKLAEEWERSTNKIHGK